jgi:hypothetical protein
MLEPTNGERADDPLGRFRDLNARHAKDTWTPATEPIETAMEGGFHDGIKFAARRQASRPRPAKSLTEEGSPRLRQLDARSVRARLWHRDFGTGEIGRADIDGGNANQSFITGATDPLRIAVDAGHIYWADYGPDTIGRADLDGQNVNQSSPARASRRVWRSIRIEQCFAL